MEKKINWYRTPIDKGQLRQLTVRSNIRGLLQSGSILLIYLATVYFSHFFFARRLWIPMAAACYLHCMFHGFVGMEAAAHELSHGTPFKTKWLNEFFYHLFCFLSWNNSVHFRVSHLKHHQSTVHMVLYMVLHIHEQKAEEKAHVQYSGCSIFPAIVIKYR